MSFLHRTWAEINLANLKSNYRVIKEHTGGVPVVAVVKANAYGHGAQFIAPALQEAGVDFFAVSNIDEALSLRSFGITGNILILGYTPTDMAGVLCEKDISQCVYSMEYAKMLSESAEKAGGMVKIHIKLDTGMGRIGFNCRDDSLSELDAAVNAATLPNLQFCGLFTHFAVSDRTDDTEDGFTDCQYSRFVKAKQGFIKRGLTPKYVHCCNSAAILKDKDKHSNLCRAGIILYGLSPDSAIKPELDLKPVMTLKSTVSMVKEINAGDTVNYGRTFKADKKMRVATVAAGYADGYPRALSNKGYVMINGQRANIIGRICMDQLSVDVSDIEVNMGDEVILFGEFPSVTDIAPVAGTINYEIICNISPRVPRIIKK